MSIKKLFDEMTFKEKFILIYATIFLALSILFYIFKEYDFINYILISLPFITLCILFYNKNIFIENDFSNGFFIGMILFAYAPIIGIMLNTEPFNLTSNFIIKYYIPINITIIILLIIIKKYCYNQLLSNELHLYILLNITVFTISLFLFINYNLDKNKSLTLKCIIIDKKIIYGGRHNNIPHYYLIIKKSNLLNEIDEIKVKNNIYCDKNRNDTLYIEYHKGGLKLPWFKVSKKQNSN